MVRRSVPSGGRNAIGERRNVSSRGCSSSGVRTDRRLRSLLLRLTEANGSQFCFSGLLATNRLEVLEPAARRGWTATAVRTLRVGADAAWRSVSGPGSSDRGRQRRFHRRVDARSGPRRCSHGRQAGGGDPAPRRRAPRTGGRWRRIHPQFPRLPSVVTRPEVRPQSGEPATGFPCVGQVDQHVVSSCLYTTPVCQTDVRKHQRMGCGQKTSFLLDMASPPSSSRPLFPFSCP